MKKDILIIAHFCSDFDSKGNNRFNYLAKLLSTNNFNVELVTSDFSHAKKIRRDKTIKPVDYKLTYIEEPKYIKNISLKRFYSHYRMSKNLKNYLRKRKKPDVIYCAVPSLSLAKVAAEYASKHNIRFMIDVQDLWPEAFMMVFNVPLLSEIVFRPLKNKADYIYKTADDIIAVSETYVKRAEQYNKKAKNTKSIYIGTDLKMFDEFSKANINMTKPKDEFWIGYVGTLGNSYDISSVINAIHLIQQKDHNNIKLIVMGDGPLKSKFSNEARRKKVNALFTGNLNYETMVGLLTACDIAVNPIVGGSAASIINKHADYAAAALPVINTQESSEYRNLVTGYNMGINCENGDVKDIADKILFLYHNSYIKNKMSINSRKLAEEKFDRQITYYEIIKMLNNEE